MSAIIDALGFPSIHEFYFVLVLICIGVWALVLINLVKR